jgi:hypothetical protein
MFPRYHLDWGDCPHSAATARRPGEDASRSRGTQPANLSNTGRAVWFGGDLGGATTRTFWPGSHSPRLAGYPALRRSSPSASFIFAWSTIHPALRSVNLLENQEPRPKGKQRNKTTKEQIPFHGSKQSTIPLTQTFVVRLSSKSPSSMAHRLSSKAFAFVVRLSSQHRPSSGYEP